MVRVCSSILFPVMLLSACTAPPPQTTENAQQPAAQQSPKENILACSGLPLAGQKCGLALPKIALP